jgi:uncharacterized protein YhjY with autotransporter beta-barrel domain
LYLSPVISLNPFSSHYLYLSERDDFFRGDYLAIAFMATGYLSGHAATFTVGDSTVTVTNTVINNPGGLSAGDTINFNGTINPAADDGVDINPVPANLIFNIGSGSSITSVASEGFRIRATFDGVFTNRGKIIAVSDALNITGDLEGSILNYGLISSTGAPDAIGLSGNITATGILINRGTIMGGTTGSGVEFVRLDGMIKNFGMISGGQHGVSMSSDLGGTLINQGTISGDEHGVSVGDDLNANSTLFNSGTISGDMNGISIVDNSGGKIVNSGTISGGDFGIFIGDSVTGSIKNHGAITSESLDAVFIGVDLDGSLVNHGTISSRDADGIDMNNSLNGSLVNRGKILAGGQGIEIDNDIDGAIRNYGTILSTGADGIFVGSQMRGTVTNWGTIEGETFGIRFNFSSGTMINDGGRVSGSGGTSIALGSGDGTLVLSGPSHLEGTADGGAEAAGDVLRFQNMRGLSQAKQQELAALAAADSDALTTISLFGEKLAWQDFEDIQVDLSSLVSYQSLIDAPGLGGYAAALDNLEGLNDEFRELLAALNNADASLLNEYARSLSGKVILDGITDYAQLQDGRVFALLMQEMGNLRNAGPGLNGDFTLIDKFDNNALHSLKSNLIAMDRQGVSDVSTLDQQSVQPIEASKVGQLSAFVTGHGEATDQDATADRSEGSSYNTTALIGAGSWLTENLYAGGFGGYTRNIAEVDAFNSDLTSHTGYVGFNLSYTCNNWFANIAAGYGIHSIYSQRNDFIGNEHDGDANGHQAFTYAQIGYDWVLGETGTTKITPYVGMTYSALFVDGYTENGPAATALNFDDDVNESLQTVVGLSLTRHIETPFGYIRPIVDAAWWHAFDSGNSNTVQLATPGLMSSFDVGSSASNEDRATYGLGVAFNWDAVENMVFMIRYNGSTGSEGYQSHGGSFGARYQY